MMNDRFNFRVWYYDKDYYKTCSYEYIGDANGYECLGAIIEDHNYIVEQCTGIKDKNGKLIFEGDIIESCGCLYEVVYAENYCCYELWDIERKAFACNFKKSMITSMEAVVIGNIHENKELL